jgi:hypothetical protein
MTIDPTKHQDEQDESFQQPDQQSEPVSDLQVRPTEKDEQVKGGKIRSADGWE